MRFNIGKAKRKLEQMKLKVNISKNDRTTLDTFHNQQIYAKSARTVGAKGRVFAEALTQVSFSWGGPFFAGKMHGTFIKRRNLQLLGAQTASPSFWCYNFAATIFGTNKMWNLGAV